jgi:hypothetical protein
MKKKIIKPEDIDTNEKVETTMEAEPTNTEETTQDANLVEAEETEKVLGIEALVENDPIAEEETEKVEEATTQIIPSVTWIDKEIPKWGSISYKQERERWKIFASAKLSKLAAIKENQAKIEKNLQDKKFMSQFDKQWKWFFYLLAQWSLTVWSCKLDGKTHTISNQFMTEDGKLARQLYASKLVKLVE